MPRLSVIIPVYNAELSLGACLDSLLCQDSQNYEIVLVNDGSTDRSRTICEDYARRYNNIMVIHQENGGVSSARNKGLDAAKGDFISFVDADDRVTSDYLSVLLSYAQQDQAADILFFGMNVFQKGKPTEVVSLKDAYSEGRTAVEESIYTLRYGGERDVFGWTCDKMIRADIIRRHHIRFPENVHFREDELFTFDFCRHVSSLRVVSTPLYNYLLGDNGLTGRGMQPTDFLPSSIALENCLPYYQHEGIREHMLHSITSYRALHIYKKCPLCQVKQELEDYRQLTDRLPQPGKECPVQHLTQYLQKGFWMAYLYCLIRKL